MIEIGLNDYIDNETYHGDREFISSSGLKMILNDPRKFYKEYILNEGDKSKGSSAMDFGSYLHCAILEPELLDKEFAIYNGVQRRGAKFEEFKEANKGKTIITSSDEQKAKRLIQSYKESTVVIGAQGHDKEVAVSSFYSGGFAEQTATAIINGVKIKVRADYRKEFEDFGSINDLKTTGDNIDNVNGARRVCDIWTYDLSAALYVDVFTSITGKPHDFYFTFLSKANGECRMYKASEEMLASGREKYLVAIEKLKKARESGIYYINKIQEL